MGLAVLGIRVHREGSGADAFDEGREQRLNMDRDAFWTTAFTVVSLLAFIRAPCPAGIHRPTCHIKSVTAIAEVIGDGQKVSAAALE